MKDFKIVSDCMFMTVILVAIDGKVNLRVYKSAQTYRFPSTATAGSLPGSPAGRSLNMEEAKAGFPRAKLDSENAIE